MRVVLFFLFVVIMFLVWSWLYYDFSIFVDYVFYVCKDEIGQIYYYNIIFVGYEFCDKFYVERNSFGLVSNILFFYLKVVDVLDKEYQSICLIKKLLFCQRFVFKFR